MGIIGRLFGSDKTTEKVIDATISGVDSLFFTKEEGVQKISEHLKNLEPFKLMQRLLVLSITFTLLFSFLVCLGFVIASGYGFENGKSIATDVAKLVIDFNIGYAFTAIVTVYISGGVLKRKK